MDVCTRIDSTLKSLKCSLEDGGCCLGGHALRIKYQHELRFLKMFFWCYANWEYAGKKYDHLEGFVSELETADNKIENLIFIWVFKEDLLIPEIKEISLDFIHSSSISCKSSPSVEIHQFLVTIQENLEDLLSSNAQMFVTVKEQIEVLQQKLKFFRDLIAFTAERCISNEQELKDFMVQVQAWANRVACLLFLYWVDRKEEETVPNLKNALLHVLETNPCTPVVKRVFVGALKASKSLQSEALVLGNLVANSVDLILEDLMASMEDSIKTSLRDGLIILITFLMDPPPTECGEDGDEILSKTKHIVDHIFFCVPKEEKGITSDRYFLVIDFLKKIKILEAEIRKRYVRFPDVSLLNFPRTNGLGFIDLLLGNLKERASSIIFAKSPILAMQEKLLSVRTCLKDLMEQQNEFEEVKHLWTRIINGAYMVDHVVDLCFFGDDPIWHKMICLSILKDEFEFIMTEVQKIGDEFMDVRIHNVDLNSLCAIPKHGRPTSRIDELIVGFKDEATKIIDQLTRGSRELKVVSIVGMPGQGKTTLADRVYNDPSVKSYFYIRAWCIVSQKYQLRELLLKILSDVTMKEDMSRMSEEDLAEKLYKCLKGRRYLIVIDDIWEIKAWDELNLSFPSDNNGSRIIFTSRIQSIASQAKLGSSTHLLCPLSVKESWELLQKKLFHDDRCPPYLAEVGMKIVEICQGLPLSIVVTAGVLARRVTDLDWWKEIEGNLSSKILGEGSSRDILELSYQHLPDYLKPCFLYFGAFQRGKPVNVRMLTQLWFAEGFIPKIGLERPENVARNFLNDLIDRSLVIVVNRSSSMRVKECRVHDLLFELCLAKVDHDNFLMLLKDSQDSQGMEYNEYRLSIDSKWSPFVVSNRTLLFTRTLLGEGFDIPEDPSFFMRLKFLRVMHLNNTSLVKFSFRRALISLIHLRYLVLFGVEWLPSSIGNLQNLEVLHVEVPFFFCMVVPDTIWNMKRLRHLHVRPYVKFGLGNRYLECAKLINVDTLSWPKLCCSEHGEELLRRFPNVRELRIQLGWGCQLPELGFLRNLESLNLCCLKYDEDREFPCDLKFPSTLKKLTLKFTRIPWSEISTVAKLPNLQVLKLLSASFVGERWDMDDEDFLNLKFLKLVCLDVEEWNPCTDPFPCLQRLVLIDCFHLQEIPPSFAEITTLDVIEVHNGTNKANISVAKILKEKVDYGNDGFQVLITKW